MLSPELVDAVITGIISGAGLIMTIGYSLKKFKLLHFGRLLSPDVPRKCIFHDDVEELIDQLKETQRANIQRLDYHTQSLVAGEKKFDTLQDTVSDLKEGIGILMDRTGGRPVDWRGKKR